MEFDFEQIASSDRYRLLCSFVAPRPIALVTTIDADGRHNAAPMSFFNVFSQDPPIVILGIQARADGTDKDTAANIRRSASFVVHMVDMTIARQMIVTSVNFESDIDEIAFAGLSTAASVKVGAPRIAEAPCAMECVVDRLIEYDRRMIVLGRVVQMHVRDELLDERGRYVLPEKYQPIARLHADNYIVADSQFELKKPADLAAYDIAGKIAAL